MIKQPNWIPIKQRPPNNEFVLVYCKFEFTDDIVIAEWFGSKEWRTVDFFIITGVTHWMPLPDKPNQ